VTPREIPASLPSLKWPLIWIALAIYVTVSSLCAGIAGLFGQTESGDAPGTLLMCPLFALGVWAAVAFYRRRLDERAAWRQERFMRWMLADNMPAPEQIDWHAFERDVEDALIQKRDLAPSQPSSSLE